LDILKLISNKSEQIKEFINRKLWFLKKIKWVLRRLSVISKNGKIMNPFFPLLVFLLNRYWKLLDDK
jgi:hypothetical protein